MCLCTPARKRALEGQDSEQTSAPPLLMQVSWARGAGFPLGRHFTPSEEYRVISLLLCDLSTVPRTFTNVHTGVFGLVLTDAIFLVPVEFLSGWTHTLVAALGVYAAVLTAAVVDAALIDI